MRKSGRGLGLVLLFLCVALRTSGQGGATGAITGTVLDKSGREVAGAKVSALNESTREVLRTEVTDSSGLFTMTLLPAGTYTIQVTADGFADTKAVGVAASATEPTRLTIPLQLRSAHQTLEVSAIAST